MELSHVLGHGVVGLMLCKIYHYYPYLLRIKVKISTWYVHAYK